MLLLILIGNNHAFVLDRLLIKIEKYYASCRPAHLEFAIPSEHILTLLFTLPSSPSQ